MDKSLSKASKDNYFKIAFLGNSAVGKTSLINYLRNNGNVDPAIPPTLGVDVSVHEDKLRDGTLAKYFIFDTAGQERFKSVPTTAYKETNGVLLVYSVTDRASFDDIHRWVQEINTYCRDFQWCLIGNKSDIDRSQRKVSLEEGQQLARAFGINHFETSIFDKLRPSHAVSIRQIVMTMGEGMAQARKERKEKYPTEGSINLTKTKPAPPETGSNCRC